jgi:hypothetical protein
VTGGEIEMDRDRGINCFELYNENYKGGEEPGINLLPFDTCKVNLN